MNRTITNQQTAVARCSRNVAKASSVQTWWYWFTASELPDPAPC